MNLTVSVIVPTYQRREDVRRAVATVLAQSYRDFELIVIDDGSDDGTGEALAPVADRIRYRWQANRGVAAARNAGLALARGRILAFLDSDDRWLPDHLATVTAVLAGHPEAVLASTCPDFRPSGRQDVRQARLIKPLPRLMAGNFVGLPSCVAARHSAVEAAGGFDERLDVGEDGALWQRLALQGPFVFVRRRTVVRGRSANSLEERGHRNGGYLRAAELGTSRLLQEMERGDPNSHQTLRRAARGSLRLTAALGELDGGDPGPALSDACALLPELSREPGLVHGRLTLAVPGFEQPQRRLDATAELAAAWPDRRADSALRLLSAAVRAAFEAGRPRTGLVLAGQWARRATPRYLTGTPRRLAWRGAGMVDRFSPTALALGIGASGADQDPPAQCEAIAEAARQALLVAGTRSISRHLVIRAHQTLALAVGAYLRRPVGGTVYLRGGFGAGEPVPGVSDVDLVVVVPGEGAGSAQARRLVQRRWQSLRRRFALLGALVEARVEDEDALRSAATAPAHAHGLVDADAQPASDAVYVGRAAHPRADHLDERPGLHAPLSGWRRLIGPGRRPVAGTWEPQLRPAAAWLELQFWWAQAFGVCRHPAGPRAALSCVKLVTEPARIWLWLEHGERAAGRAEVLERALRRMPEEKDSLRGALGLLRRLHRFPDPPVEDAMATFARLSDRIAGWFAAEAERAGSTPVKLRDGGAAPLPLSPHAREPLQALAGNDGDRLELLPLVDWRARTLPVGEDDVLAPLPGDPADPDLIATAAAATGTGAYPAFRAGDLIVLPAASWWRGRLRAVQCPATDPVSCALLEGSGTARFPEVLGLSAKDCARRAVAEHRAWLESTAGRRHWPPHLVLTTLLAAARAACFLESVDRGAPELAITADAVADELAARGAGDAAEAARAATWAARVDAIPPPDPTVVAVRREVERMPAYAEPRRFYREGKGELANPQPPPASPVARSRRGST